MPDCRHAVTVARSRKKIKLGALALFVCGSVACKHEPAALAQRPEAPASQPSLLAPSSEQAPPLPPSVSVVGNTASAAPPAGTTSADGYGLFASREACLGELAQARAMAT